MIHLILTNKEKSRTMKAISTTVLKTIATSYQKIQCIHIEVVLCDVSIIAQKKWVWCNSPRKSCTHLEKK